MGQIDLRGYPQNIQNAAKEMFRELRKVQKSAQQTYKSESQFIYAIEHSCEEGLITEEQKVAALSLRAGELVLNAASPGYTCFRRDYLILEGENPQ